jgi:hypothetical protein
VGLAGCCGGVKNARIHYQSGDSHRFYLVVFMSTNILPLYSLIAKIFDWAANESGRPTIS